MMAYLKVDATYLAGQDERVVRALDEENAYWTTSETRLQMIRQRCRRAGYRVYMPRHRKKVTRA